MASVQQIEVTVGVTLGGEEVCHRFRFQYMKVFKFRTETGLVEERHISREVESRQQTAVGVSEVLACGLQAPETMVGPGTRRASADSRRSPVTGQPVNRTSSADSSLFFAPRALKSQALIPHPRTQMHPVYELTP